MTWLLVAFLWFSVIVVAVALARIAKDADERAERLRDIDDMSDREFWEHVDDNGDLT